MIPFNKLRRVPVDRFVKTAIVLPLALAIGSCQSIPLFNASANLVNLNLQVTESSPGVYTLSGDTNLPNDVHVAVAAVRYLSPLDQRLQTVNAKPTYSILDYQLARVENGQWKTRLNLWQVAPDGRYQEAWQLEQAKLRLRVKPEKDVVFLATLSRVSQVDQLQNLEQVLSQRNLKLEGNLIFTTAEGQQYVRVGKVQPIDLPTSRTSPPAIRPEDVNGGWGRRYLMPGEPPNSDKLELPKERRTTAPITPSEVLY